MRAVREWRQAGQAGRGLKSRAGKGAQQESQQVACRPTSSAEHRKQACGRAASMIPIQSSGVPPTPRRCPPAPGWWLGSGRQQWGFRWGAEGGVGAVGMDASRDGGGARVGATQTDDGVGPGAGIGRVREERGKERDCAVP